MKKLKQKLLQNNFDFILLNQEKFNEDEFNNFCKIINEISEYFKEKDYIDKEIILKLYLCQSAISLTINDIITTNKIDNNILNKLDNANSIIDEFIIDILFVNKKIS